MERPSADAPFDAKLAYYRSIHTSRGVRATHLVGIPTVVVSLPLLVAKPRVGAAMFLTGWATQIAGHILFEKNRPVLRYGPVTYQLTGLATWASEVGDLLARAAAWRQAKHRNPAAPATRAASSYRTAGGTA